MVLLHYKPDLYVFYCACEARGGQGPDNQSSFVRFVDWMYYCWELIVQSGVLPSHPLPASCSQILR